jgi:hypothetical protein
MTEMKQRDGRALLVDVARGQVSPGAMTQMQENDIVRFCRDDIDKRLLKIERDVKRGAMRPARRKADALRSSLAGRLYALWKSLPHHLRDDSHLPDHDRAERRARRWVELVAHISEVGRLNVAATVELRAKPKGPPGENPQRQYRPIMKFGWIDQAKQRLIAFSLAPFVDFHPSQHLLRQSEGGRGRSAVYKTLLARLPELGPDHVFVQLDVKRFYQNISHAWLEEHLPLPKDVIRAQVHTGGMTFLPIRNRVQARLDRSGGAFEELARRGLPTGSALSSLVGEYVMAEALRELADHPDAPILCVHSPDHLTYSDNIGLIVEIAKAAAVVDLYRRAFASSAAGPFSITVSPPRMAHGPFKFLGYWFRVRDGRAEAYVPDDVADRLIDQITQDILMASLADLERMRDRVNGVAADWRYWDGVNAWRTRVLAIVKAAEALLEGGGIGGCNSLQHRPQDNAAYPQ